MKINANLGGAILVGANLQAAHGAANLNGAVYAADGRHPTLFPAGFNPAAHGMVRQASD